MNILGGVKVKLKNILLISAAILSGITLVLSPLAAHAEDFNDETNKMFEELKEKYTDLSNNYGNIDITNTDEIYQQYLSNIQRSKEDLNIGEKLDKIENTDLSVDNSELKKEFNEAKQQASNKLQEAKLNSEAIQQKFNTIKTEQSEKEKEVENARIEAAAKKYTGIVADYYELLNKKGTGLYSKPYGIGQYKASDLKYLAHSMGINFNKAITTGKLGLLANLGVNIANEASKLFGGNGSW